MIELSTPTDALTDTPIDALPGVTLTQEESDALADRIAAVLRERGKIGAERRMRARQNQLRSTERARERDRDAVQICA